MCKKCNKNSCSGCGSSSNDIATILNELQDVKNALVTIQEDTKFLRGGHPILQLFNADDIALFDFTTGLGQGKWDNWALCDGQMQEDATTGLNIQTPPLQDMFIVGAGNNYQVGDTGGLSQVVLGIPNLPTHNHPFTDPGHDHSISDPGHSHGASSASHIHSFTPTAHTHVAGNESSHIHTLNSVFSTDENGGTGPYRTGVGWTGGGTNYGGDVTNAGSAHTHDISQTSATGTIGGTSAAVTIANAFTGIGQTEIAITGAFIGNTGSGTAHENLPPYFSLIFIIKL